MATKIIFSTVGDIGEARRIASTLVEERLAACVNLIPNVESIYRWQGRIERDAEVLMLIKTEASREGALTRRLVEIHPYDLPECIAVAVDSGSLAYMEWVSQETRDL